MLPATANEGEVGLLRARIAELERRIAALEGEDARRRLDTLLRELSEVQRQLVALVATGRTNREVAARIHLSPKTVEWHLTKAYRRLGVRSRTELAALLGRGGALALKSGETPGEKLSDSEVSDKRDEER